MIVLTKSGVRSGRPAARSLRTQMESSPAAAPSIPCPGMTPGIPCLCIYWERSVVWIIVCTTHTISQAFSHLWADKMCTYADRLAPENTCDVPISTSHLSFAAPHVTTQFDQWLGHSVDDKLQPWSCRMPPVPTSSTPFDQWL